MFEAKGLDFTPSACGDGGGLDQRAPTGGSAEARAAATMGLVRPRFRLHGKRHLSQDPPRLAIAAYASMTPQDSTLHRLIPLVQPR